MRLALNVPLNSVSFGQVSFSLLKEMLNRSIEPSLYLIGGALDLSMQDVTPDFLKRIDQLQKKFLTDHSKDDPSIKLWHLNGSIDSVSRKQLLISFYELDSPTAAEVNAVRNSKTFFTSQFTVDRFADNGAESRYLPLFFDKFNFKVSDKEYFSDDRVVFNLCGKFEKRKHHAKILSAWSKKYGGDNRYSLQCALYNPFLSAEENERAVAMALDGEKYSNIQVLSPMQKNCLYNDFLNSGHIVIAMSGGEGWGLPEFHSVALGAHSVALNAHSYKGWANEENSCLVEPSGKIEAYDGKFFIEGSDFNQGKIFDWDEDAFLDGCDKAIERHKDNPVNEQGLNLQKEFTVSKTLDILLQELRTP